jgi:hypothetical protein
LLQGHAKPLIERHFLALAGIVTTFYPYLEATPGSHSRTARSIIFIAASPALSISCGATIRTKRVQFAQACVILSHGGSSSFWMGVG